MTGSTDISVGAILATLDLQPAGEDVFTGHSLDMGLPQVFGGQLLAQSLVAASRSVPQPATANSMHLYFLRPGDIARPMTFHVERVRDGRRLSVRTVRAVQDGRVLATTNASFVMGEAVSDAAPEHVFPEHQAAAPPIRRAEDLPTLAEQAAAWGGLSEVWACLQAMDCRAEANEPNYAWLRLNEAVPDDPLLHQTLLAYLSDVTIMAAVMAAHGLPMGIEHSQGQNWDGVSLDHAIWFHRHARADDWLLFVQDSPSGTGGRALARANVYSAGGGLAASIAQEGLFFLTPG